MAFCSVEGCEREQYTPKGYCNMHYQRMRRHGTTDDPRTHRKPTWQSEPLPESKVCTGCERDLPLSEYAKHKAGKYGLRPRCRDCHKSAYETDRERILEKHRAYWHDNPEERFASSIRSRYGLTVPQWQAMHDAGCAICGALESNGKYTTLHVDHDHDCCPGKRSCGDCVRGMLCASCNTGLGQFQDDPNRLIAAAAYLITASVEQPA